MKQLVKLNEFEGMSKGEIIAHAKTMSDKIEPTEALTKYTLIKRLEDYTKALRLNLKQKAIEGYTMYMGVNKGELKAGNDQITLTSGYQTLDYDKDPEYANLKLMLSRRKKELDDAKRTYDKHGTESTTTDGVVVPVVPVKGFVDDKLNVSY